MYVLDLNYLILTHFYVMIHNFALYALYTITVSALGLYCTVAYYWPLKLPWYPFKGAFTYHSRDPYGE